MQSFLADPEHPDSALNSIPKAVLQQAKGLAIFSVVKAGFVWSGKAGSGVVTARLSDGSWSAPSCIATGGVGFGLQVSENLQRGFLRVSLLKFFAFSKTTNSDWR